MNIVRSAASTSIIQSSTLEGRLQNWSNLDFRERQGILIPMPLVPIDAVPIRGRSVQSVRVCVVAVAVPPSRTRLLGTVTRVRVVVHVKCGEILTSASERTASHGVT